MATTRVPCSSAAKTQNPLKLAGVPQTRQQISAVSFPKFSILRGHVEEILLLNKFLPIVDTCLSCKDIARQSSAMVPRWQFFGSCISSEPCAAYSDLHSKFALGPHHVYRSMVDIQSVVAEIRRGIKRKKETTRQKYNGLPYSIGRP